ncbi:zinc-finger of transposase IS204/IS1001/IS1096/IS1165, partial [Anaerosphaera aminiphila DSM 21120]
MQDNYIQKLLNIKDIIVTNITENSETIEVSIKSTNNTGVCPCCKQPTTRIHDYRLQRVRHSNIGLRQVCLLLRKKRFICKRRNKRFYESLNFLGRYQRNTKEYIFTLLEKLKDTRS